MQEVQILAWCDVCFQTEGQKRSPKVWSGSLTIDGLKRNLDLCERHEDEILQPIVALLQQCGTVPAAEKQPPKQPRQPTFPLDDDPSLQCPECGKQYASRPSMVSHINKYHGKSMRELRGSEPPEMLTCEVCGFQARAPQGMGAHKRAKHDITGTSEYALRMAAEREAAGAA